MGGIVDKASFFGKAFSDIWMEIKKQKISISLCFCLLSRGLRPKVYCALSGQGHLMGSQFEGCCLVVTSFFKHAEELGKGYFPVSGDKMKVVSDAFPAEIIVKMEMIDPIK